MVYAEPLSSPNAIQVRHRREGARNKYQIWGRQLVPYDSWRIDAQTDTLMSVEGMLDMLILPQALEEWARSPATLPLYTGGSSPSHQILVPNPDEAGWSWMESISAALTQVGSQDFEIHFPPDDLDPDEAILGGWWPEI